MLVEAVIDGHHGDNIVVTTYECRIDWCVLTMMLMLGYFYALFFEGILYLIVRSTVKLHIFTNDSIVKIYKTTFQRDTNNYCI